MTAEHFNPTSAGPAPGASRPSKEAVLPATESAVERTRYSAVAMGFHWGIAALILCNLCLGLAAARTTGAAHRMLLDLHKPIGMTVLVLTLGRLAWRLTHRPPEFPDGLHTWERALAKATHAVFYGLMLLLPFAGWWLSSAVPMRHPFGFFGVMNVPFLPVPQSKPAAGLAHDVHVRLAYVMIGLIALHLAGVIKHQLFDKTSVLSRMTPVRGRTRSPA